MKEIPGKTVRLMGGSVEKFGRSKDRVKIEIGDVVISNEKIKKSQDWSPIDGFKECSVLTFNY